MDLFMGLILATAGLAVGAVLAAVFFRLRSEAMLEAAVAHGRAGLEVELASQLERLHAAEAELLQARKELVRLRDAAENWRKAYEASTHDQTRLSERSSRLPQLESEVARLTLQVRMDEEQMQRLAASEAQKQEALQSLREQIYQHEQRAAGLQARLDTTLRTLHEIGERRAALEPQAARVGSLEEQLRASHTRMAVVQQQLLDLREASARENGRQAAELLALREDSERLRGEAATARALQAAAQAQVSNLARELAELRLWTERALSGSLRQAPPAPVLSWQGGPGQPEDWSETALSQVLAAAGLREGHEVLRESGQVLRVTLPQGHTLRVDAGVPLATFDAWQAAGDEPARAHTLAEYLAALRQHALAAAALAGEPPALSLVLVPSELAFMLAVAHAPQLLPQAWEQGVLLASPSTLLYMLRVAVQLRRDDEQARNGRAIARQGARVYERVSEFSVDLGSLRERLLQAQLALDAAEARLRQGQGSVANEAEVLRELGCEPAVASKAA